MSYLSPMLFVAMDTNCLIDAEQGDDNVREIARRFRAGEIRLGISAAASSENTRAGQDDDADGSRFRTRLENAGMADIEVLPTPFVLGLARLGHIKLSDKDPVRPIFESLFPDTPYDLASFAEARAQKLGWTAVRSKRVHRNRMCDVLAIWSLADAGGGWFVTRDQNFHKKSGYLQELAIGVLLPQDAATRLAAGD